jgi:hypothetical protein
LGVLFLPSVHRKRDMTEQFVPGQHSIFRPHLSVTDGVLEVQRKRAGANDQLTLIPGILFGSALCSFFLFVAGKAGYSSLRDFELPSLLFSLGLGAFALVMIVYLWTYALGSACPFYLRIGKDTYRLKNGLMRISRVVDMQEAEIVIRPMTGRHINWGYSANFRCVRRGFRWPFFYGYSRNTKEDAAKEALALSEWIEKHAPEIQVTMAKSWGDIRETS